MDMKPCHSLIVFFSILAACSSNQNLGESGKSKAGESCSKSGDCADNLRCVDQKCGGSSGKDVLVIGGDTQSCDSDQTCALRGASEPYCKNGGACTECLTDAHCAKSVAGPHCKLGPTDQDMNFCSACLADADCAHDPAYPRCAIGKLTNFCVACFIDADCKDKTRPRCQVTQAVATDAPSGDCVECLVNADCKDPASPICRNTICSSP
jgi:hypothetical protein